MSDEPDAVASPGLPVRWRTTSASFRELRADFDDAREHCPRDRPIE